MICGNRGTVELSDEEKLPERVRWDDPKEKTFVALRKNLLRRPILRLIHYAKPFVHRLFELWIGCCSDPRL